MPSTKVIISTKKIVIRGYKVVQSIKNLDWSKISCLIFNSTVDDDLTVLLELSKLKGKVNLIYINENINPLYYSVFHGLNADIYKDESCFSDKDILDFMVSKYGKTGFTVSSAIKDFENLSNCINDILKADAEKAETLVRNELWVKTLNSAMASMDTTIARSGQTDSDVVELLGKAHDFVIQLKESNKKITDELNNLSKTVEDVYSKGMSGVPLVYSAYNVPSATKKVLYIKFYGHCQYLTSFLMAYQHYLIQHKSYSSKMLIMYPKLPLYISKYKDIPRLASDTIGIVSMDYTAFCTYEPRKRVLESFFNTDQDLYIVLDLMFGTELVKGTHVIKMNAVSGMRDIDRFKLDVSNTFFSVCAGKDGWLIPYITGYSDGVSTETSKRTKYFQQCGELYKRLDKKLSL